MNMSAAVLELLMSKGLTIADAVELAQLMEAQNAPAEPTSGALRTRRYRERFQAAGEIDWAATRLRIFERDNWTCVYCGDVRDLHCDHATPLISGGLNVEENLVTACASCNREKSGRTVQEWLDA